MKPFAAAILAFILMFVFAHRPIVRSIGTTKLWRLLIIDLVAASAVYVLVS